MRKVCTKCKVEQNLEAGFSRAANKKDGYSSQCKACKKEYALLNPRTRTENDAARERIRGLMRYYNMTLEEYETMWNNQEGLCAICERPERATTKAGAVRLLAVDHDHRCCPGRNSCGQCIRALLCTDCNQSMGKAGDSPKRLRAMADYIESYGGTDPDDVTAW